MVTFYQDDIVDDDDIRGWLKLGKSKGEDVKQGSISENYKKFWMLGARLLQQISEQDSSDEEDEESEQEGKKVVEESEEDDDSKVAAPDSSSE